MEQILLLITIQSDPDDLLPTVASISPTTNSLLLLRQIEAIPLMVLLLVSKSTCLTVKRTVSLIRKPSSSIGLRIWLRNMRCE